MAIAWLLALTFSSERTQEAVNIFSLQRGITFGPLAHRWFSRAAHGFILQSHTNIHNSYSGLPHLPAITWKFLSNPLLYMSYLGHSVRHKWRRLRPRPGNYLIGLKLTSEEFHIVADSLTELRLAYTHWFIQRASATVWCCIVFHMCARYVSLCIRRLLLCAHG